jgi:hypothetical protein
MALDGKFVQLLGNGALRAHIQSKAELLDTNHQHRVQSTDAPNERNKISGEPQNKNIKEEAGCTVSTQCGTVYSNLGFHPVRSITVIISRSFKCEHFLIRYRPIHRL